jgi:hypothetical protein
MLVSLLYLLFYPEDGDSIFFRNVGKALSEFMVLHPKQ